MNTLNWGRLRLDKEAVALRPDAGHDAKLVRMKLQVAAMRSGQPFRFLLTWLKRFRASDCQDRITA